MERCSILLLDDDEDDYQLLKSLVKEAFNGAIELDWFQRDGFADTMVCSGDYFVTLIEYKLGIENGLAVIQKVKAKCPQKKIFLLTSWNEEAVSDEEAYRAGADQVLRKTSISTEVIKWLIQPLHEQSRC